MTIPQPSYASIPSSYRDAIQDTAICGTILWAMTELGLNGDDATKIARNAKLSHLLEDESSEPPTGRWLFGGHELVLDHHHYGLVRLWGFIRWEMSQQGRRSAKDPYLFTSSMSRPQFSLKTLNKRMIRWVDLADQSVALCECGFTRPPRLGDALLVHTMRGGDASARKALEVWMLQWKDPIERVLPNVTAMLFGGPSKYVRDKYAPTLRKYGINIIKHYPWKKSRGEAKFQQGVDVVLIMADMIGHSGAYGLDVATELARQNNVPWVTVSRKEILAVRALKDCGILKDVEEQEEDIEPVLEEQVTVAAEFLASNGPVGQAALVAHIETKTGAAPIDDTVYSRAKALEAILRKPEPEPPEESLGPDSFGGSDYPDEPEPVAEPEPEEEIPVPQATTPQGVAQEARWKVWRDQRLGAIDDAGFDFTSGTVRYRVALCPQLDTTTGKSNTDQGRLIVAMYPDKGEPVLISRRDGKVHALAATAFKNRDVKPELAIVTNDVPPPPEAIQIAPTEGPMEVEPMPEPMPEPVTELHPYAEFEQLKSRLADVMKQLGFTAITLDDTGKFSISGQQ